MHVMKHQLEVVWSLLWGMFYNRMESHGLDLWKGDDMQRMLKIMATHKRDFEMHNKLNMLCKTKQDFMEHSFALDLVVWHSTQPAMNGTNKEGSNGIQTDDEGEYKSGRNCLKIHVSLKEEVSPEGQAMRNNKPGTSNLL
jgi:hypothetical protein